MIILQETTPEQDRTEAFRHYAERRAQGEVAVPPLLLPPEERRLYVRQTLREDHRFRIQNRPEGAQAKFDKLARSPFTFFRGTALLYYRDYAGSDLHLPVVLCVGDVHPENFGVMPNAHGAPFFGIDDYDEAWFAPFTYDVKRGAVGFFLAAVENGFRKKVRQRVVEAFVEGYVGGLRAFAKNDRERWHEFRLDNSPRLIHDLIASAQQSRRKFLSAYVDFEKERFRPTDEVVPLSGDVERFQQALDGYRKRQELPAQNGREISFRVKDVAVKKGGGTASLGLDRFLVLIEGTTGDPDDDLLLELKQARRPALFGLVPLDARHRGAAEGQAVEAHRIHLAGGDPFYGRLTLDGAPFLVREHSPYKKDLDVADLDARTMADYAAICGETLAQTHARADEDAGLGQGSAEVRILSALQPAVFIADVARFAAAAARRVRADYRAFTEDHALGAFSFVDAGAGAGA